MTVYECDLSAYNRDAIEGLHMVEEAFAEYSPITMFEECFTEAFCSKKKKEEAEKRAAEIKAKEEANAKAAEKGTSGLRKALDAVLAMCRAIISGIDNFFQEHKLDKAEKEAYENFKAACKQDPSLANKKITVRDYKKTFEEYQKLMKECEKEMTAVAKDADHPLESMLKKMETFVKEHAKGVAVSVGATAAINVASVDRQFAKYIRAAMYSDERLLQGMKDSMGKKEFKKMDRSIKSLSRRLSLKRRWLYITNNLYKDVTSAVLGPLFDVKNIGKGMIKGVSNGIKNKGDFSGVDPRKDKNKAPIVDMLFSNKSINKTAGTVDSFMKNITKHGVRAGHMDKLKYIGGKLFRPKTFEARGLYGNTTAGKVADGVKSALHPVGKTGKGK